MRRTVLRIARSSTVLIATSVFALANTMAGAEVLFESGTLGPTGVIWGDLENQVVPGTNISTFAYNGVRFELTQPAHTAEIGGHFVAKASGTFFGALVALDDEVDFPDSGDLSTPDVLGYTLLTFPTSSAEVFGQLERKLDPGWYAIVFGGGLFGATANGGAVRNGIDIGRPSYIAHGLNLNWYNLNIFGAFFDNHRFVIKGAFVPEPSTVWTVYLLLVLLTCIRHR